MITNLILTTTAFILGAFIYRHNVGLFEPTFRQVDNFWDKIGATAFFNRIGTTVKGWFKKEK